ncbi:MAG: hypothetical protein BWY66_01328 [bacterium ADurb.Bin374]|nr:MAG: hypothetical protein BWY66_01328 [bacterium ADurb.Bin374]
MHKSDGEGRVRRGITRVEGKLAREEFPEHDADGVDVGLMSDVRFSEALLGSHVMRRSESDTCLCLFFRRLCDAEVENLQLAFAVHEYIGRFNISVNNTLLMTGRNAVEKLDEMLEQKCPVFEILLSEMVDRLSVDEFHDQKRDVQPFIDIRCIHRDDGAVGDRRENAAFVDEPLANLLVRVRLEEKLDGDFPTEIDVKGLVHLSHAADAQLGDDFVVSSDYLVGRDHA